MTCRMFSSGTEYEIFKDNQCYECRRYVDYDDSYEQTEDDKAPSLCPIEYAMEMARFNGEEVFPDKFVKPNDHGIMCCMFFDKGEHPSKYDETKISDYWKFKEVEQ